MTRDYPGLPHQIALWNDQTDGARIALVAALGQGKTYALAIKARLLAEANAGTDGLLIVPTFDLARMVHLEEWPGIIESLDEDVSLLWRAQDSAWVWITPEGSWGKLWVRSAEAPKRVAGPNLGYVIGDEPGQWPDEAWERGSLRARHPKAKVRQVVLGGTPEGLGTFFSELFADPKPPYRTIWGEGWHTDMAHYPAQVKRTYAAQPSLLAAYGKGQFVPMRVGRCYEPFNRQTHVSANGALGYNPSLELACACDFNIGAMRWEIGQKHPGMLQVLDEIALGEHGPVKDAAKEVVYRYGTPCVGGCEYCENGAGTIVRHAGRVRVTGDATGSGRMQTGEVCYDVLLEIIRPHFPGGVTLDVPTKNPPPRDRVDTVNYHLGGQGYQVLIHPQCVELIADLEQNAWKKGTSDIDKPTSGPGALRTHAADGFGYWVWAVAPIRRPTHPVKPIADKHDFVRRDPILGANWA